MLQKFNRRLFVKSTGAAVFLYSLPLSLLSACENTGQEKDEMLWYSLAETLFPPYDNSPTLEQTGFLKHLFFFLSDTNADSEMRHLLRQRFDKFKSFLEKSGINFSELPLEQRTEIVEIVKNKFIWAEKMISQLENLLFEACFLDPYYGVNKQMIGWKWVRHPYGKPRPDKETDYFTLLEKRKKTEIIHSL